MSSSRSRLRFNLLCCEEGEWLCEEAAALCHIYVPTPGDTGDKLVYVWHHGMHCARNLVYMRTVARARTSAPPSLPAPPLHCSRVGTVRTRTHTRTPPTRAATTFVLTLQA
ncbi:hypothetical protein EON68_03190 [archaeon]|nr:MAG: hypothetical protein EON68_03190 [archaeon]